LLAGDQRCRCWHSVPVVLYKLFCFSFWPLLARDCLVAKHM
jgi:hypothetical protein